MGVSFGFLLGDSEVILFDEMENNVVGKKMRGFCNENKAKFFYDNLIIWNDPIRIF